MSETIHPLKIIFWVRLNIFKVVFEVLEIIFWYVEGREVDKKLQNEHNLYNLLESLQSLFNIFRSWNISKNKNGVEK